MRQRIRHEHRLDELVVVEGVGSLQRAVLGHLFLGESESAKGEGLRQLLPKTDGKVPHLLEI